MVNEVYVQLANQYRERIIADARAKLFLGSAKVNIDVLDVIGTSRRILDPDNVQRLVTQFQAIGCSRLDNQHHIPAEIDPGDLQTALSAVHLSLDTLKSGDTLPLLEFRGAPLVRCLHGRHRIEAAKVFLQGSDRWWIVDFFAKSNDSTLRDFWNERTYDEEPLTAGQIYFNILRCDPKDVLIVDALWARIRSQDARKELRRLDKNRELRLAFERLAEFPCFAKQMLAGNVGSLLRLKYQEECVRYLAAIYRQWTSLLDHDTNSYQQLDYETIVHVEARAPANSLDDRRYLRDLFDNNVIFTAYSEVQKSRIWQNLLNSPRRWLSLFIFFEDFKFLEIIGTCVRQIIRPRRRETQRAAFLDAFAHPLADTARFDGAYQAIHLYAMRNIELLRPGSLRLEKDRSRISQPKNAYRWYSFASYAKQLGFASQAIEDLLMTDPNLSEAQGCLERKVEWGLFSYTQADFDSSAQQIANLIGQSEEVTPSRVTATLVATDGSDEACTRRYGRPFQKTFTCGAPLLTAANIGLPDSQECGVITSFYSLREFFLMFFGTPVSSVNDDYNRNIAISTLRSETHSDVSGGSVTPVEAGTEVITQFSMLLPDSQPDSASRYSDVSIDDSLSTVTGQYIKFVKYENHKRNLVQQLPLATTNREQITGAAEAWVRERFKLFDEDDKALAPHQCYDAAVKGQSYCIILRKLSNSISETQRERKLPQKRNRSSYNSDRDIE